MLKLVSQMETLWHVVLTAHVRCETLIMLSCSGSVLALRRNTSPLSSDTLRTPNYVQSQYSVKIAGKYPETLFLCVCLLLCSEIHNWFIINAN